MEEGVAYMMMGEGNIGLIDWFIKHFFNGFVSFLLILFILFMLLNFCTSNFGNLFDGCGIVSITVNAC